MTNNETAQRPPLRAAAFWAGCFLVPVAVLALECAWCGVYPFGPESFLTEDAKFQYFDLFAWFRHVLLGEASAAYVPNTGLGSNAWGLVGYYLSSPFNVLLLAFDEDHLTDFFWVITALKLGCVQVSATWYLSRRFRLAPAAATALALCYTWSLWTATQLRNPLWLDALVLLPVAAYGVYLLVREERWLPLAAALAVAVVTCWYTAYLMILFLSLFAVLELVAFSAEGGRLTARRVARRVGLYLLALACALALSAFTFLPTVLAMLGGFGGSGLSTVDPLATSTYDFLSGFFFGTWRYFVPQHFASTLLLVLGAAFLAMREIPLRIRVAGLVLLAFMLASAFLSPLQYLWSGLRVPRGFYCRIAFLTVFLVLWVSAYAWRGLASARSPRRALAAAAATVALAVTGALAFGIFPTWEHAVTMLALAAVYALVAHGLASRRPGKGASARRTGVSVALCSVVFLELLASAHLAWTQLYVDYPQERHDRYVSQARAQLQELEGFDDGPYRTEKTYTRVGGVALNEGMSRGYLALSTYASSQDIAAVRMLQQLGYSNEGDFSVRYAEPLLATDSLLGVKYVSSDARPAGFDDVGLMQVEGPAGDDDARFYQNPYALPLGYGVSAGAAGFALGADDDPFERQNALASALVGEHVRLYAPLDARVVEESPDAMAYEAEVPAGLVGYVYVSVPDAKSVLLGIDDGPPIVENDIWHHAATALADASDAPQRHRVSIAADVDESGTGLPEGSSCLLYGLDIAELQRVVDRLSQSPCTFAVFEPGHIEATCEMADDGYVLVSVPAARGWAATVNGQPVQLDQACDGGLMLVPVREGRNDIVLRFTLPGQRAGIALSAGAAMALVALALFRRRVTAA